MVIVKPAVDQILLARSKLRLEIRGPGHHERSELAAKATSVLEQLGFSITVTMDIRPRLAADISQVLESGAERVVLVGKGFNAVATRQPAPEGDYDVDLVLMATADKLGLYDPEGKLTEREVSALKLEGVEFFR
jgi:hypothetical protein